VSFDKKKKELVYHSTNFRDAKFIELARLCKETDRRLVLILPTTKKYSAEINQCFEILNDDLLIYEISMGLGVVLESRARKYVEYIETAELYE